MSDRNELLLVEIDGAALHNTDRAVLVRIKGEKVWVPFSIIGTESEVWKKGDEGRIVLPRWFCEQEEIEHVEDDR